MKRILVLIAAAVMLVALVACGKTQNENTPAQSDSNTATTESTAINQGSPLDGWEGAYQFDDNYLVIDEQKNITLNGVPCGITDIVTDRFKNGSPIIYFDYNGALCSVMIDFGTNELCCDYTGDETWNSGKAISLSEVPNYNTAADSIDSSGASAASCPFVNKKYVSDGGSGYICFTAVDEKGCPTAIDDNGTIYPLSVTEFDNGSDIIYFYASWNNGEKASVFQYYKARDMFETKFGSYVSSENGAAELQPLSSYAGSYVREGTEDSFEFTGEQFKKIKVIDPVYDNEDTSVMEVSNTFSEPQVVNGEITLFTQYGCTLTAKFNADGTIRITITLGEKTYTGTFAKQ